MTVEIRRASSLRSQPVVAPVACPSPPRRSGQHDAPALHGAPALTADLQSERHRVGGCSLDHLRGAQALQVGRNRIHYSVITRAELFAASTAADQVSRVLGPFREIPVDRAIAGRAGRIRREVAIPMPDALIAATAVEHRLAVVTRNTRHFENVRGLRLRSPG